MYNMLCFENVTYNVNDKIKVVLSKVIVNIKKFFIIDKNNVVSRKAEVLLDDGKKYNVNGRLPNYFISGCKVNVLCCIGDDLMVYQIYDVKLKKLYVVGSEVIGDGYSDEVFGDIDVGLKKIFGEKVCSLVSTKSGDKHKTIIKFDNNNENFIIMDNVIGNFNICDVVDVVYMDTIVGGVVSIFIWKIYNHNSGKLYVYEY